MTLAAASASHPNSAFSQATCKAVELLGAERPDLELIIWASLAAQTDEEVNELAALIPPEDTELLERVVKSVFWNFGLNLCDYAGGLPA